MEEDEEWCDELPAAGGCDVACECISDPIHCPASSATHTASSVKAKRVDVAAGNGAGAFTATGEGDDIARCGRADLSSTKQQASQNAIRNNTKLAK